MASPFVWALLVTSKTTDSRPRFDRVAPWAIIWLVIMAIAAVALLIAVLAAFDRKLGRGESRSSRLMNGIFTRRERAFRFVFLLIAAIATVVAMYGGRNSDFAFVINGTQVLIGLLLSAIAATNSTARQFERDSTAPPVWLGQPPLKTVLANLAGPLPAGGTDGAAWLTLVVLVRWRPGAEPFMRIWLVPAYIMFSGAAWCRFGVAVGMRFTRRTALLSLAAAYALVLIGAPHRGGAVPRQPPIADPHGRKPVRGGLQPDNV